jgi:hypothetical protein
MKTRQGKEPSDLNKRSRREHLSRLIILTKVDAGLGSLEFGSFKVDFVDRWRTRLVGLDHSLQTLFLAPHSRSMRPTDWRVSPLCGSVDDFLSEFAKLRPWYGKATTRREREETGAF